MMTLKKTKGFQLVHKQINLLLSSAKLFSFFYVVVFTFFLTWVSVIYVSLSNEKFIKNSDFLAFYTAGLLIQKEEAKNIYDKSVQLFYQKEVTKDISKVDATVFRYPPFVALFFYPFAILPFKYSFLIFTFINLVVLLFISLISVKKLSYLNLHKIYLLLPLSYYPKIYFLLPLSYYPIALSLIKGQVTIILTFILLVVYLLLRSKPFWAGIFYSLFLVKPHFFLVGFPFFLLASQNRKRFFLGTVLSISILIVLSLYLVGVETLIDYPQISFLKEQTIYHNPDEWKINFSLSSVFNPLMNYSKSGLEHLYLFLLVIYLVIICVFAVKSKSIDYQNAFLSAVVFMVILSPHAYPYDYAFILLPILIVVNEGLSNIKRGSKLFFLTAFLLALPNIHVFGSYILNPLTLLFWGLHNIKLSSKI